MFVATYEEWSYDDTSDLCTGDYADEDTTTTVAADTDFDAGTKSGTCAYDLFVQYDDGTASGSATTQVITISFDSGVVTAASAFALAGVAALFF